MLQRFLRFEVRRESLPDALAATRAFVDEVQRKEGGTAFYKAYQEKAEPTRFTHHMAFRTPSAEQYHQGTAWAAAYHAKLAGWCVSPPVATPVEEVLPAGKDAR